MLGFLARTLRNRSTAEDVFQQVFLEAWERGPSFDPARGSVLTWLMTIARSRAIDQLRRRVPEPRDPAGSLALLEGEADPGASIDDLVEQWRMAHLLGRLPRSRPTCCAAASTAGAARARSPRTPASRSAR